MNAPIRQFSKPSLRQKACSVFLSFLLFINPLMPAAMAQTAPTAGPGLQLPLPTTLLRPSPAFQPPILQGMTISSNQPFRFEFIVNMGEKSLPDAELKKQSTQLLKYFLASLTVPEKELWVNLSPYEKTKVIPDSFGKTEMGRDLLTQDYLLKQLTASLIYPEDELGGRFWDRVYQKLRDTLGTTNVAINTFNKVWIVPEKAEVYENARSVYVVNAKLKVMLEKDYFARAAQTAKSFRDTGYDSRDTISNDIIRQIILPEIEKEVNEGRHFAELRQIYHSLILAVWYKKKFQQAVLNQIFSDQHKTRGIDYNDPEAIEWIWQTYVKSFKEGVYSFIKETYEPAEDEYIPRKYVAGGFSLQMTSGIINPIPLAIGSSSLTTPTNTAVLDINFTPDLSQSPRSPAPDHKNPVVSSPIQPNILQEVNIAPKTFQLWQDRSHFEMFIYELHNDLDPGVTIRGIREIISVINGLGSEEEKKTASEILAPEFKEIVLKKPEVSQEAFEALLSIRNYTPSVNGILDDLIGQLFKDIDSKLPGDHVNQRVALLGSIAENFPARFDQIDRRLKAIIKNKEILNIPRATAIEQLKKLVLLRDQDTGYLADTYQFLDGLLHPLNKDANPAEAAASESGFAQAMKYSESKKVLQPIFQTIRLIAETIEKIKPDSPILNKIQNEALDILNFESSRVQNTIQAEAILTLISLAEMRQDYGVISDVHDRILQIFNENENREVIAPSDFESLQLDPEVMPIKTLSKILREERLISDFEESDDSSQWRRRLKFDKLSTDFKRRYPLLDGKFDLLERILQPPSGALRRAGIRFLDLSARMGPRDSSESISTLLNLLEKGLPQGSNELLAQVLAGLINVDPDLSIFYQARIFVSDTSQSIPVREGALMILEKIFNQDAKSPFLQDFNLDNVYRNLLKTNEKNELRMFVVNRIIRSGRDIFDSLDHSDLPESHIDRILLHPKSPKQISRMIPLAFQNSADSTGQKLIRMRHIVFLLNQWAAQGLWKNENYTQAITEALEILKNTSGISLNERFFSSLNRQIHQVARLYFEKSPVSEHRQAAFAVFVSGLRDIGHLTETPLQRDTMSAFSKNFKNGFGLRKPHVAYGLALQGYLGSRPAGAFEAAFLINFMLQKHLNSSDRAWLVKAGLSYAKTGTLDNFLEIMRGHQAQSFKTLVSSLKKRFIQDQNLPEMIDREMHQAYTGAEHVLALAEEHPFLLSDIVHGLINYLQNLDKQYASDEYFNHAEDVQIIYPALQLRLISILNRHQLPVYDIHRLLRLLPLGNAKLIEELREAGRQMNMTVTGSKLDSPEGGKLFWDIRKNLHDGQVSEELLQTLLSYTRTYGLSESIEEARASEAALNKGGYTVNDIDQQRILERRAEIETSLLDLIKKFSRVKGTKRLESLEEDINHFNHYAEFQSQNQSKNKEPGIETHIGKITYKYSLIPASWEHIQLAHLDEVVSMRKKLHKIIADTDTHGDLLYYALQLDIAFEQLLTALYENLPAQLQDSEQALVSFLENTVLDQYDTILPYIIKTLKMDLAQKRREVGEQGTPSEDYYKKLDAILREVKHFISREVDSLNRDYMSSSNAIHRRLMGDTIILAGQISKAEIESQIGLDWDTLVNLIVDKIGIAKRTASPDIIALNGFDLDKKELRQVLTASYGSGLSPQKFNAFYRLWHQADQLRHFGIILTQYQAERAQIPWDDLLRLAEMENLLGRILQDGRLELMDDVKLAENQIKLGKAFNSPFYVLFNSLRKLRSKSEKIILLREALENSGYDWEKLARRFQTGRKGAVTFNEDSLELNIRTSDLDQFETEKSLRQLLDPDFHKIMSFLEEAQEWRLASEKFRDDLPAAIFRAESAFHLTTIINKIDEKIDQHLNRPSFSIYSEGTGSMKGTLRLIKNPSDRQKIKKDDIALYLIDLTELPKTKNVMVTKELGNASHLVVLARGNDYRLIRIKHRLVQKFKNFDGQKVTIGYSNAHAEPTIELNNESASDESEADEKSLGPVELPEIDISDIVPPVLIPGAETPEGKRHTELMTPQTSGQKGANYARLSLQVREGVDAVFNEETAPFIIFSYSHQMEFQRTNPQIFAQIREEIAEVLNNPDTVDDLKYAAINEIVRLYTDQMVYSDSLREQVLTGRDELIVKILVNKLEKTREELNVPDTNQFIRLSSSDRQPIINALIKNLRSQYRSMHDRDFDLFLRELLTAIARSTGRFEDLQNGSSGGGIHESVPDVYLLDDEAVLRANKTVLASLFSRRAFDDRRRNRYPHKEAYMAIKLVQQVKTLFGAIGHSVNPRNPDEMFLDLAWGHPEVIAAGGSNVLRLIKNRKTGQVTIDLYPDNPYIYLPINGKLKKFIADKTKDPTRKSEILNEGDPIRKLIYAMFKKIELLEQQTQKSGETWPRDVEFVVPVPDGIDLKHPVITPDTQLKLVTVQHRAERGLKDVPDFSETRTASSSPMVNPAKTVNPGGIDLDPAGIDLSVMSASNREVDCLLDHDNPVCVQLSFTPEQIEQLRHNIAGLTPVILNIRPVTDLMAVLGGPPAVAPQIAGEQNGSLTLSSL